ncbi:tRNA (adenosine(37)-N6)-threonylcarbamoyltransferase complex dimerization subunit type 1 TsaB [Buchnera aphidicola]|uniref:tRNA (adenosine(37)-N6)-threonylcarbamoyltransferase complex dimerization subunit type 1 TsaB n=1 Tax=Buchnera aphidicola TaxID=9 RepID=UPI003464042D
MNKIILSIDASCSNCSTSLFYNKKIDSITEKYKINQTKEILIMINKLLKNRKISLKLLDAISFTTGPGKFTGIRTVINIAQSLALGTRIKLFPISTLLTIAERAWRKKNIKKIVVTLNANHHQAYWAKYIRNNNGVWKTIKKDSLITILELNKKINLLSDNWTVIGNVYKKLTINPKILINKEIFFPHAKDIIPFTLLYLNKNTKNKIKKVFPNYLNTLGLN